MNFYNGPYHLNSFKCFKKKSLNFKKQKHCFFMDTAKSSGPYSLIRIAHAANQIAQNAKI